MTLPRYQEYRGSGVAWLGEVPAHWAVTRLRHCASVQTGIAKGKDNEGRPTVAVPYLRVANVQDGYLALSDVATIEVAPEVLSRYTLRYGDVLMNEGGDVDKLGRGCIWRDEVPGCIHQNHVFSVRPHAVSPDWLNLLTGSAYAQFYFMTRAKQSTNLASISSSNIMELPLVLPPAEEQSAIAAFLDHETAKIDALIAEQEKLVALLAEKRQATISHAVIRGLDPDAPMKDSGVAWLGEVPAHWQVAKLGLYASVENGTTPSRAIPEFWNDGDIPWLASGEVNQLRITEASEFITDAALENCSLRLLPIGTVVVGLVGQGRTRGMSAILLTQATINQNLAAVSPRSNLEGHYVLYLFHAMYNWLREAGRGGNQAAMNCEMLSALRIPIPPLSEQRSIIEFVERGGLISNSLAAQAERAINLLRERRSALIAAAVTGQIDVRETVTA